MIWTEEAEQNAAYRAPLGRELFRPDTRVVERPGWYQIITPSAEGHLNEVYISQVEPADAERAIDEVIAEYIPRGASVKWCVGHWTEPKDFRDRLRARGFEPTAVRAMVCATNVELHVPASIATEEVTLDTVDAFVAFEARGWGVPENQLEIERAKYNAELRASPQTGRFFSAYVDGVIVGSAGIFLRDGFGYFVGGLVAPEARGRGVYRALVAARLAFLRSRGITRAVTHAREATSAPMLEHLGFRTVYPYECWYLHP